MCIISCRLLRTWRKSWSESGAAIGSGNLVNAQSNWRAPDANAVRMNFGASRELARSSRAPEQFFARYGNGGKKKRTWPIDLHSTFYKTASFLKLRKVCVQDALVSA